MTDWAKDDLMDPPYADEERASKRSGGARVIRHVVALGLVVVAIGGLAYAGWFGYNSWRARGSEGLAPIIQADAGPTRVRPEQPGGLVIPHQDRLVLHDLNGGGASVSAETLLPPPEEPMPRPVAVAAPAPAYAAAEAPPPAAPIAPAPTAAVQTAAVAPAPAQPSPVARDAEVKVPTVAAPEIAQAAEPPPELITRPAAEAAPAPELVPVGNLMRSHRVQLAAVDSEESARRAWLRYQGLYQDLLGDLSLLVQQVEVNNRTYFRVQGGPLNGDSAGRICQSIKSRGADCLVVRPQR